MVAPTKKEQRYVEKLEDKIRTLQDELSTITQEISRKERQFIEAHEKMLFQKANEGISSQKELDTCTLVQRVNLHFKHDIIKQNFNPDGMLKDVLKLKSEGWKIGRIDFVRVE